MIFQDATFSDFMRVIHATFKALLKILKSVILSPPRFLSPIIVDFLILGGFPSQMKLKIVVLISLISCTGITSTDVLSIYFERPNVLTMFILPRSVRFLLFQLFPTIFQLSRF